MIRQNVHPKERKTYTSTVKRNRNKIRKRRRKKNEEALTELKGWIHEAKEKARMSNARKMRNKDLF